MARSLWLFNLFLALLALLLVYTLLDSFSDRQPEGGPQRAAGRGQGAGTPGPEAEALPPEVTASVPPLSDFDLILARDAFKNPSAAPRQAPSVRPPPPPPPPPLPTLLGTIFVGEERKAILASNNRSDIYDLGESVAGGTLVKIEADRVVIQRATTTAEILLKTAKQQVSPAAGPAGVDQAAPQSEVPAEKRPAAGVPRVVLGYSQIRSMQRR